MNNKFAHIFSALLAALLLFLAVGYHGWACIGSAFSEDCKQVGFMRTVGGLLVTAGILICLAALIIVFAILRCADWLNLAAVSVVILSTIFSAAGVFFYYSNTHIWSPFMATIAMTISFVLTALLLIDVISERATSS